jgi:hypothetical protein
MMPTDTDIVESFARQAWKQTFAGPGHPSLPVGDPLTSQQKGLNFACTLVKAEFQKLNNLSRILLSVLSDFANVSRATISGDFL